MGLVQVLEIVAFHYSCTILAVVVVAGCAWSIWVSMPGWVCSGTAGGGCASVRTLMGKFRGAGICTRHDAATRDSGLFLMFCGCLYSPVDRPYSASLYSCPNVILVPHCSSAKNPLRDTRDSVASLLSPWIMACFHELYPQINKTRSVLAAGVCEARSCWG